MTAFGRSSHVRRISTLEGVAVSCIRWPGDSDISHEPAHKQQDRRTESAARPRAELATLFPLAEELRKVGRYDEAERVLRDGIDTHPAYLSAWVSLGRVLAHLERHPMAVESFKRALKLDPENVVAARLMAESCLAMGDKLEAIKKFKLVHALLPSDQSIEAKVEELERELNPHLYTRTVTVDSSSEFRNLEADAGQVNEEAGGTVTMRIPEPQDRFIEEPAPEPEPDSRFMPEGSHVGGSLYRELEPEATGDTTRLPIESAVADQPPHTGNDAVDEPAAGPWITSDAADDSGQPSVPFTATANEWGLGMAAVDVDGGGSGIRVVDALPDDSVSELPGGSGWDSFSAPGVGSVPTDQTAADQFLESPSAPADPFSDLASSPEAFSQAEGDLFEESAGPGLAATTAELPAVQPAVSIFDEAAAIVHPPEAPDRIESQLRVIPGDAGGSSRPAVISRLERWLALVNRNAGERV